MPQVDLSLLNRPGLLWWLALSLALLVAAWSYYRLAAPLGPGLRHLLRAARILAYGILLFVLLEPMLTIRSQDSGHPRLALLVDRSSSMRLPGGRGATTRAQEAAELLMQIESALGAQFDLEAAGFASNLEPRRGEATAYPWEPLGVTAMGEALEEVLVRQADVPVGGVLLLSDGVHTAGKDPALVARNLPAPIFAIVLGDTISPPDLLIRQVRTQAVGCVGEPLAVRAVLESDGLAEGEVTLTVREWGAQGATAARSGPVLAQRTVKLPPVGGPEVEAALEISPTHVGLTLFAISATLGPHTPVVSGVGDSASAPQAVAGDPGGEMGTSWAETQEAVTINNTRLFAVEVREKKTRVLYIEHEPDWDFGFLKRTFDADTTLSYTYLVRQPGGNIVRYGSPALERLPRSRAELTPFAAVILGRAQPHQLPPETVAALKQFVLEGGGVLFLGAADPGDLGRWKTAWSDLMPVSVRAEPRWGFTQSPVEATLQGLAHEITALGESPAQSPDHWKSLPPLWIREGSYQTAPGAMVLLTAQTAHPSREIPLLTLAQVGTGRLAVVTGRGFWRWDFVMRSVKDVDPVARDFWKRVARWLAEPSQRGRFHVSPARHVFQDSEPVAFEARLYDEAFQPLGGARVDLTIEPVAALPQVAEDEPEAEGSDAAGGLPPETRLWGGDRQIRFHLYPDGPAGRYAASAAPLPPGIYRYRARATVGSGDQPQVRTSEGQFWVEWMGPEFFDLAASRRLPTLLAEASGGLVVGPADLADLVSSVPSRYKRVHTVRQAEMWNHWALFACLMIVLSLEWILRRRKGLA